MTHLWIDEPITVVINDRGEPTEFVWQGKGHLIKRVLNAPWELGSDWWRAEGGIERRYLLVFTDRGMICVIYQDQLGGEWRFRRRYD